MKLNSPPHTIAVINLILFGTYFNIKKNPKLPKENIEELYKLEMPRTF